MERPSLFVIVPGFGAPHTSEKIRILQNNINRITKGDVFEKVDIRVCCYDPNCTQAIPQDLWNNLNIEWIVKKGIVGQYIYDYAPPDYVKKYDYVLIILDDVELMENIDLKKMIAYQKHMHLDIVSPSMTVTSKYQYPYMLQDKVNQYHLKIVAACEAFCYFMPVASYIKYHSIIEPKENPWLWGVDLVLWKYHGFHIAVLNHMQMHHHYKNECYALRPDTLPTEGYNSVLRKYNATSQEFENTTAVLFFVFATSGL